MGATGAGKSNFGNYMLDGRDSQRFKSSAATVSGVTTKIRMDGNNALGNSLNPMINVIDMPGFGDPNLPLKEFAEEIT